MKQAQILLLPSGDMVLFSEITAVISRHSELSPGVSVQCRSQDLRPNAGLYQRAKDNKDADGIRDDIVKEWDAWLEAQGEEPAS